MNVRFVNFQFYAIGLLLASCTGSKQESTQQDSVAAVAVSPEAKASAAPVHWGYEGDVGPEKWGTLSPVYAPCSAGKAQSPIDLISSSEMIAPKWSVDYKSTSLQIAHHEHVDDILDNGHTIQVTVQEGSTFNLNDKTYELKQFHFHTPSEHTIDGKRFPLEMHMVHQASDGSFGVIGLLFEEGPTNENFKKIIDHLPSLPGESSHFSDVKLDLQVHVPNNISAYHYSGSLTTPPCLENVEWLVLRNKFYMSADQLKAFSTRLNHNNRPIQPLNDRKLTINGVKSQE